MRAVRRNNATGAFSWIGSDGWSARNLVSDGNEAEVEGTLSVQPQANPVRGFEEYFLNLTVEGNRRNPWFVGKYRPVLISSFHWLVQFLGAFAKLRKAAVSIVMSVCLSVCPSVFPHGTTRLPMYGFS